jgi:hypothetical protein
MPYVVFGNQTAANQFRDNIDADFGFPINGVRMGGGIHASVAQGRTTRYAPLIKHPTLNRWAFPDDPIIRGKRPRVPLPGGATSEELDGTWEGAQPTSFRAADPEI